MTDHCSTARMAVMSFTAYGVWDIIAKRRMNRKTTGDVVNGMRVSRNIALDYDNTYSADPELWDQIVRLMQSRGWKVFIVTARMDTSQNHLDLDRVPNVNGKYFTSMTPKVDFMERQGITIDIWIDDDPYMVTGETPASIEHWWENNR